jgi:hypothetical protein
VREANGAWGEGVEGRMEFVEGSCGGESSGAFQVVFGCLGARAAQLFLATLREAPDMHKPTHSSPSLPQKHHTRARCVSATKKMVECMRGDELAQRGWILYLEQLLDAKVNIMREDENSTSRPRY